MSTDLSHQQRDVIKSLSPPWLADGIAEKILYAIGLGGDAVLEKLNQAIRARLPGRCDPSALPLLGNDRVMAQGPNESNSAFSIRLKKAFDTWQRAGARRSVLQQVLGYVANPNNVSTTGQVPIGAIVGSTPGGAYATWDVFYSTSDTSQPPHHQRVAPANWNWDGKYGASQAYLVLYFPLVASATAGTAASVTALSNGFATITGLSGMAASSTTSCLVVTGAASAANNGTFQIAQVLSASSVLVANPSAVVGDANNGAIRWTLATYPALGPAPAWGTPGITWGAANSFSWGLNVSASYFAGLRSLVQTWKNAATFFPWIIISFGGADGSAGSEFSPISAIGTGNPDGNWGSWAKTSGGVSVPARSTGVNKFSVVCDGVAIYQQSYVPTGT